MKKKSTQFRWFVTMLLLVTAMAMPKMALAQNQMYTELSSNTLTFKYGEKPTGGEGITVYDIPDASNSPDWNSEASSITTVVDNIGQRIPPVALQRIPVVSLKRYHS